MTAKLQHLRAEVERVLALRSGHPVQVSRLARLLGGACQDNYHLVADFAGGDLAGERQLVLRADARRSLPGSIDRRQEFHVIGRAVDAAVPTPRARWLERDLVRPGAFSYFLDWCEGVAAGRKVVGSPELASARRGLASELAIAAARIHTIRPDLAGSSQGCVHPPEHPPCQALSGASAPATRPRNVREVRDEAERGGKPALQVPAKASFPGGKRGAEQLPSQLLHTGHNPDPQRPPAEAALDFARRALDAMRGPHPAMEAALAWLREGAPSDEDVVLVHGDFRTGNFMVTPRGLAGILDWEFAHWGSPLEDLAWLRMRDWRFGKVDRPIGGFAAVGAFDQAYEEHSGRRIEPRHLRWWEVMSNLGWATGCVYQAERYLSGPDQDLELLAIGRRAAEMEHEALRLIRASA